jgi:hypothetical protein
VVIATIPFTPRPSPAFRVFRRRYDGPAILIAFPRPAKPRKTSIFRVNELCSSIVRRWKSEAEVLACKLCRSGCVAQHYSLSDAITCNVFCPPALTKEEAAGFRCNTPQEHYRREEPPPDKSPKMTVTRIRPAH